MASTESVTVALLGTSGDAARRVRGAAKERGWKLVTAGITPARARKTTLVAVIIPARDELPEHLTERLDALRRAHTPVLLVAELELVGAARTTWRCGADDFASPQATQAELALRLEMLIHGARRRESAKHVQLGNVIFDRDRRVLSDGEQEVRLTSREFILLEALAEFSGTVVTRENLAHRVWGKTPDESRASNVLEVYINYLRKKLALLGAAERVRTVRGVGYALAADRTSESADE